MPSTHKSGAKEPCVYCQKDIVKRESYETYPDDLAVWVHKESGTESCDGKAWYARARPDLSGPKPQLPPASAAPTGNHNGLGCGHPWSEHNEHGCTDMYCRCVVPAPVPTQKASAEQEGWIPATERMPELHNKRESRDAVGRINMTYHTSDLVLTYIPEGIDGNSSIQTKYMIQRRLSYIEKNNQWVHKGVTHWQPLPTPPVGKEGER